MQEPSYPGREQATVYQRGPGEGRSRWRDWLAAGLICLVIGVAGGGQGQSPGGRGFGGGLQGQITAVNGDLLTVSTRAGSLQVRVNGSTAIRKAVAGKRSDLAVGDTVAIGLDLTSGNGNGIVTARSVTEEPAQ